MRVTVPKICLSRVLKFSRNGMIEISLNVAETETRVVYSTYSSSKARQQN